MYICKLTNYINVTKTYTFVIYLVDIKCNGSWIHCGLTSLARIRVLMEEKRLELGKEDYFGQRSQRNG